MDEWNHLVIINNIKCNICNTCICYSPPLVPVEWSAEQALSSRWLHPVLGKQMPLLLFLSLVAAFSARPTASGSDDASSDTLRGLQRLHLASKFRRLRYSPCVPISSYIIISVPDS